MYVDYAYYASEYGGEIIPENKFSGYERRAEAYIRKITYVRGDIFSTGSDMVKDAVCAVADVYCSYDQKQASAGMVKSENNDGYSVTYVTEQTDGQTAEEVLRKKAYAAASAYLLPTGMAIEKGGMLLCWRMQRLQSITGKPAVKPPLTPGIER